MEDLSKTNQELVKEISLLKQRIKELERLETERKQMEEALRAGQVQLSDAADIAGIVYWQVDAQDAMFIFNDPFYAFYGTAAEREGGYRMAREEYAKRFVHPDDRLRFCQMVDQNITNKDSEVLTNLEHRIIRRDGEVRHVLARTRIVRDGSGLIVKIHGAEQDITERKLAEEEQERLILQLKEALSQVKVLSGLLRICSSCKKIRNEEGDWEQMEKYIRDRSEVDFSHTYCPECAEKLRSQLLQKE